MGNPESIFNKLKKETPFKITDQYFDSLPGKIMDSVSSLNSHHSANKKKIIKLKHALAYAASFLGIIFLSYLATHYSGFQRNKNYISKNDAIEYVNFYTSDFDEVTIMENLPDKKNENTFVNDDETESIITYLVKEGIDDFTLYNEL